MPEQHAQPPSRDLMDRVHQQYNQEGSLRALDLYEKAQEKKESEDGSIKKVKEATTSLQELQTLGETNEIVRGNEIAHKVSEILTTEQMKFMQSDRDIAGITLNPDGAIEVSNSIVAQIDEVTLAWKEKKGVLDAQRVNDILVIIFNAHVAVPEGLPDVRKLGRTGEFDADRGLVYTDISSSYNIFEKKYCPEWVSQNTRHEMRHALVSHKTHF